MVLVDYNKVYNNHLGVRSPSDFQLFFMLKKIILILYSFYFSNHLCYSQDSLYCKITNVSKNDIYRNTYFFFKAKDLTIYKFDKFSTNDLKFYEIDFDYFRSTNPKINNVVGVLFFVFKNKKHYVFDTNFNKNFNDDKVYITDISLVENKSLRFEVPINYDYYFNNKYIKINTKIYVTPTPKKSLIITTPSLAKFSGFCSFNTDKQFLLENKIKFIINQSIPVQALDLKSYTITYDMSKLQNTEYPLYQGSSFVYNNYTYTIDSVDYNLKFVKFLKQKYNKLTYGVNGEMYVDSAVLNKIRNNTNSVNKYILFDFWAHWCGPCIEAGPKIDSLIKKYNNKNVTIIGVNKDYPNEKAKADNAIQKHNIYWNKFFRDSEISNYFNQAGLPGFILIDPNNKIIIRKEGSDKLYEIEKYLDKNL